MTLAEALDQIESDLMVSANATRATEPLKELKFIRDKIEQLRDLVLDVLTIVGDGKQLHIYPGTSWEHRARDVLNLKSE